MKVLPCVDDINIVQSRDLSEWLRTQLQNL